MQKVGILSSVLTAIALTGCAAKTNLQGTDPELHVQINKSSTIALSQPVNRTYNTTSFGQYHFRAADQDGDELYGLMPLKFNHGYLIADILFFAPGTFFNLREVFPFYEFDVDAGVVRYKQKANDPWISYKPTEAESKRAAAYFSANR